MNNKSEDYRENEYPTVRRGANGGLVLNDPQAAAMIRGLRKHNCRCALELNADCIERFKRRLVERGLTPEQAVIVLVNVDDVHGGPLAESLMPGHDWQKYRDLGQVPFARGLAMREGIQHALALIDQEASAKLQGMAGMAIVVVDCGVAEVFGGDADEIKV